VSLSLDRATAIFDRPGFSSSQVHENVPWILRKRLLIRANAGGLGNRLATKKKSAPPAKPLDIAEDAWAEAVRREAVVRSLATAGSNTKAAVEAAAVALGLSAAQVYRLIGKFRASPITASLIVTKPGPQKGARFLPGPVELQIDDAIEKTFKARERPTIEKLSRDLRTDCRAAGLKPPSRKAIQARISARSLRELAKAREGSKVARQIFVPVQPGLRPRAPLAIVQIDHTKVDIELVDERTRAVLGRPWLTLLLDVFSRCVLGFHLSFDAPSATGVALAIAQGVLPKADWLSQRRISLGWPMCGVPATIHLDNAREFKSRALKRGCQQHGIRIDYRPPATPRFGGHIERLMGTLMGRVHALPGTTFSNVAARGDYPAEQKAVLTLDEFERHLALEVLGPYHNDVHSALGKTPAAAWADAVANSGALRQPSDSASFILDFLPFEERVVRREGVRLFNVLYFDGGLASLLDRADRRCRIKYDPRRMDAVFVELPEGGHLRVPCADLGRPAVTLWEQRDAYRALRAEGRRTVDEAAVATAIEEQRRLLADAQTTSKSARRALARLPNSSAPSGTSATSANAQSDSANDEGDAQVPPVVESEAWRTEFLSS
jgi:putative transposase